MESEQFSVIIVAGGTGSRMKSSTPKQFLEIDGLPIIVHTISRFLAIDLKIPIVIAAPKEHFDFMEKLVDKHFPESNIKICSGGETRFHSVKNALSYCGSTYVMVHDAVRPCIDECFLQNLINFTKVNDCAIPFVPMVDSVRIKKDNKFEIINRDYLIRIQTPQCFNTSKLKNAYQQEFNQFTDDASVWESAGFELFFLPGQEKNIKITTPDDLILANYYLNSINK